MAMIIGNENGKAENRKEKEQIQVKALDSSAFKRTM